MAAQDAGVEVMCPGCGQTVLQKAMIPVLGDGGQGVRYLCPLCARGLVVTTGGPGSGGPAETAAAADEAGAGAGAGASDDSPGDPGSAGADVGGRVGGDTE